MSDISSDAPSVKIIPPLVYLAGLVIGFLVNIWMPIKVVPSLVAWAIGGILIFCGAVLTGSLPYSNSRKWAQQFDLIARLIRSSSEVHTRSLGIQCISEWRSSILVSR